MKVYSCKRKSYKCLNFSTHKIIESSHVRIDDISKKIEEERKTEPEDYRRFIYFKFDTFKNIFDNKEIPSLEPSTVIELQEVKTKSQGPELHSEATKLTSTKSEGPKP